MFPPFRNQEISEDEDEGYEEEYYEEEPYEEEPVPRPQAKRSPPPPAHPAYESYHEPCFIEPVNPDLICAHSGLVGAIGGDERRRPTPAKVAPDIEETPLMGMYIEKTEENIVNDSIFRKIFG